jgi:uncharacterized protein (TIGR03086 family)
MENLELYRRAQDGFDAVITAVGRDQWEKPSTCPGWTVADVAGHVIWGQHQLRAWATGTEHADSSGAPGSPHPAVVAGEDPVAAWRAAREESVAALTEEAFARKVTRMVTLPGIGAVPLTAVVTLVITDQVTHSWDIGHALGGQVRLDPELVQVAFTWARKNVVRAPGFFGPELAPPESGDEQARMLAFLGRAG